jgi:hypothetical protein
MSRFLFLVFVAALHLIATGPARADVLPLPDNLVALDSEEGKHLLFKSEASAAYFPLTEQFVTQNSPAFCGVASLVMVLNALHIPAPASADLASFNAFDQTNIFNQKTEAAVTRAVVEKQGMTLDQLGALAVVSGLKADIHHASDSSLDDFRRRAVAYLAADDKYVLVNFLRSAIGEQKNGHISPLAAYDARSDRFLILDVARYKYPPIWVSAKELFGAMDTPDVSNQNRSRGYVEISR